MYLKPISNITIILVTIRLQAKTYFTIESKTRQMEQLRRSKKEPKRSKRSKMVKTNSDLNTQKWTCTQLKQKQMKHRNKTSWARKMKVSRASSVLLLHDESFQMQITTADQPLTNSFSFVLPSVNFDLPWLFVLPWQLWATVKKSLSYENYIKWNRNYSTL